MCNVFHVLIVVCNCQESLFRGLLNIVANLPLVIVSFIKYKLW